MDKKAEKVSRLAESVLKLVAQVGPEGLSFARLARSAGVSRAWIYKYTGTRDGLVEFATDHFARLFTAAEAAPNNATTAEEWLDAVTARFGLLLDRAASRPLVIQIYFRFRGTESLLGKRIGQAEKTHADQEVRQLQTLFKLSLPEARRVSEVIGSLRMGLAHAWAYGELKELGSHDEATTDFRNAVQGILRGLAPGRAR